MIYDGKQSVFSHQDQYALIRLVNTEDESSAKKHEEGKTSFALRLAKYLSTSGIGDWLDFVNVTLCFAIAIIHLVDVSFWQPNTYDVVPQADYLLIPELICYVYFLLDFAVNFYLAENKLFFTFQTSSIIEYVSVFPTLFALIGIYSPSKPIYLTRILRFLLCYRLDRFLQRRSMEVFRLLYKLIITITSIILINSTVLLVVEQKYQILEYIYFMVVTIATVGFGDVYPTTIYGRFSIIVAILVIAIVIPTQVQELTRVLTLRSKFARIVYENNNENQHILLLGTPQVEGFKTFLTELYHSDHGLNEINSVILQPYPPNEEMSILLRNPQIQNKVVYLEGHPLQKKDLKRSNAQDCKCIIVLANKKSSSPKRDDYRNIIHAIAVKQYVKKQRQKNVRVCLQVLQPSSKELYYNSLGGGDTDQVICVDELKLYLLAKTCLCPGINTLISFLIQSSKPYYDISTYQPKKSWIDDYLCGMQNEIYRVPLDSSNFVGLTFGQISQAIYSHLQIILFALEVTLEGETRVFVNPAEYLFEDYLHYGYVIATEMPDIEKIQQTIFPDYVIRNFSFPNISRHQNAKNALQLETEQLKDLLSEQNQENKNKHPSFYYVKPSTLSLGLAKVGDEKFEKHFIVCGVVPDMKYLMMPLRARSLKTIQPIIILNQDPIPTEIQIQINVFPKIYYLQGSPLKWIDLERACVGKAAALVILQKPTDQEDSISSIVDADTIFIYKTAKHLNPNINIITELASISTISFLQLSRNNNVQKYDWSVSEPFASGEIYISTMLDTLICQAYYNPFITSIFDQMILGNASTNKKNKVLYQQCKLQQSNLFLMDLHPKHYDVTFGQLFESLCLEYKMIPIGLYRAEQKDSIKPYVFLNPPKDVKLNHRDRVYVLSGKQPKEHEPQAEQGKPQKNQSIFGLKSKLQGDEGRVDFEYAKELWRFSNGLSDLKEQLSKINTTMFNQGLINKEFIQKIRQNLKQELSNMNTTNIQ